MIYWFQPIYDIICNLSTAIYILLQILVTMRGQMTSPSRADKPLKAITSPSYNTKLHSSEIWLRYKAVNQIASRGISRQQKKKAVSILSLCVSGPSYS